jgi:uncharacterized membrane protein YfcA
LEDAMIEASTAFYLAAIPAAALVGLSKGGLPVVGMLGVPILALTISPLEAAGILLPIYVLTDGFGLWLYRRHFDWRNLTILIPAAALGIGFGWATASIVSEVAVGLLVGVIGIAFCLNNWLRRGAQIPPKPADLPRGIVWGALTGFTSFVSHSGAPPFQVYVLPQKLPKLVYAGTSTIVFAAVNLMKLVPYWAPGQLSASNLKLAAVLVPFGVAATFIGARLVRILPERAFFIGVQIALLLVSLKLVWDSVRGLLL